MMYSRSLTFLFGLAAFAAPFLTCPKVRADPAAPTERAVVPACWLGNRPLPPCTLDGLIPAFTFNPSDDLDTPRLDALPRAPGPEPGGQGERPSAGPAPPNPMPAAPAAPPCPAGIDPLVCEGFVAEGVCGEAASTGSRLFHPPRVRRASCRW